jgi:hypothetical protein
MAEIRVPAATRTSPEGAPSYGTVERWLASAHPSPSAVRREWNGAAKLALIPLGGMFDAVRVPEEIVHGAVGCDEPSRVADRLTECLRGGPVIHDSGFRHYYALVPPGTAQAWFLSTVGCLGRAPTSGCREPTVPSRRSRRPPTGPYPWAGGAVCARQPTYWRW